MIINFPPAFKTILNGSTTLSPTASTAPTYATAATAATSATSTAATASTANTGPAIVNPPSNYVPMSDIVWNQIDPVNPVQIMNGDNFKCIVGTFAPKPGEGIGPFAYSLDNDVFDVGYSMVLPNNASTLATSPVGWVVSLGSPGHETDPIYLRITDALGSTITKTVVCPKTTAAAAIIVSANRTWNSNYNTNCPAAAIDINGNINPITVSDPSGIWTFQYGGISTKNFGLAPAGTYPLALSAPGCPNRNITLVITTPTLSGPIVFQQNPVSSSQLKGTVVGQLACTTPNNLSVFTISDPSFCFTVNGKNQIVITNPPSPGNHNVAVTVNDNGQTYTQSFTINVLQGTTLADSNMSMSLNSFTNYAYNADFIQRQASVSAPTVTGFPDLSKVKWTIANIQRFCYIMDVPNIPFGDSTPRGGIGRPRFACDPSTGIVYVQCHLSDTTGTPGEWFDLSASDGIYTCTKRFYLQVSPVVGPKYYVGPNANPNGMIKKNTVLEALTPFIGWQGKDGINLTGIAGAEIFIEHDPSNPNRYVNDWRQNSDNNGSGYYMTDCQGRRGINGPIKITGIPGSDGTLPYYGGVKGSSNCSSGDKGLLLFNNCDCSVSNMEMGFLHMSVFGGDYAPAGNSTLSLIRQNSGCSGDIRITNCDIHDADVPLEAGVSDGQWIINNVRLYNGSGCTSGGGANQHNAYIGHIWNIVVNNLLTFNAANGHIFKCRAANGTWTNSRFYDTERGSGFNCLDLCAGGNHTVTDCHFQKGPMSQNPFLIQFAEEVDFNADGGIEPVATQDYVHSLTLIRPIFTRNCPDVIGRNGINFCGVIGPNTGTPSTLSVTNARWENISAAQRFQIYSADNPEHDFTTNVTDTNPTYVSTFTPLNFTTPVSHDYGRPGFHDSIVWLNNFNDMPFFNARQIDPGIDDIRIPANSAPGTVICANMKAYGANNWSLSSNPQPDVNINPYINGTTWGPGQTNTFHTGESFNYATNKYTITRNSDGITATLAVGSAGLGSAGCDTILIRATSPSSTGSKVVENPFYIIKT